MDFKTELQSLVNRYKGIIKSVKVEFVKGIEVSPTDVNPIYDPNVNFPALNGQMSVGKIMPVTGTTGFAEGSVPSMGMTPTGQPMKTPPATPANLASAQGAALSAVAAAVAAAKARTPTL